MCTRPLFCGRLYSRCLFASVRSNTLGAATGGQWKPLDEPAGIKSQVIKQFKGKVMERGRKAVALIRAVPRAKKSGLPEIDYIDIATLNGVKAIS